MLLCMRTTVRLDDALLREVKTLAAEQGRTLTALIEEGLRRVLAAESDPRPDKSPPLPVSGKKGGTVPGIDLSRSADLDGAGPQR